jgi:hypothetical protein
VAAPEGLLALSVGVGLKVLDELLEEELVALVGPKGRHDPERSANRHGSRAGQVVLGGRKIAVRRPRARTREGRELELRTYAHHRRSRRARTARLRVTPAVLARRVANRCFCDGACSRPNHPPRAQPARPLHAA